MQGFWRGWHCSFNLWLVRYMYIPLGGTSWRMYNIWPIFVFVALWHDLHPRLLGWALLTCVLFAPEMVGLGIAQPVGSSGYMWLVNTYAFECRDAVCTCVHVCVHALPRVWHIFHRHMYYYTHTYAHLYPHPPLDGFLTQMIKSLARHPLCVGFRKRNPWLYRQACALVATVNIVGLVTVNMVCVVGVVGVWVG